MALIVVTGLLALPGCGEDQRAGPQRAESPAAGAASGGQAPAKKRRAAAAARSGTAIAVRASPFGRMLWGPRRQAVYVFERDRRNRSRCYGDCAEAWPPVFTKGAPVAGRGARRSLLGTTRRRDGRRQVTYAGKPLYYYAHEGRGQVLCHNVSLNGGLWWVVGPNGKRRP